MISSEPILHIDLEVIKNNYKTLCNKCNNVEVGASVKADCYGLGMNFITPILKDNGCKNFFVATYKEAVNLRKTLGEEVNIFVFYGVFAEECDIFYQYKLIPILNHLNQVQLWYKYAKKIGKKLPYILHINTGMYRLGMLETELEKFNVNDYSDYLNIFYIMSHLSSAEDIGSNSNNEQLQKFIGLTDRFKGIKRSFANSSGIFLGKEYHFDLVRPGGAIYGINPTPYLNKSGIINPVTLSVPIIQLAELPPGHSIGYNGIYKNTDRAKKTIATIALGYADGFLRGFSNKAKFKIDGFEAKVLGRVSMDLTVLDVSNVPRENIYEGRYIDIINKNHTPDDIAKIIDTNSYEIITILGSRFKRVYN